MQADDDRERGTTRHKNEDGERAQAFYKQAAN